jgi:Zn-dependent protease
MLELEHSMANKFSRFTEKTLLALNHAQNLAKQFNHPIITPEHVLLGLLQIPDCQAVLALEALKVDVNAITQQIESFCKSQREFEDDMQTEASKLSLSPKTKMIIEKAVDETRSNGWNYMDTQVILIGILHHPDLPATQVLYQHGATVETVRAQPGIKNMIGDVPPYHESLSLSKLITGISPIFGLIVIVTVIAGYLTYIRTLDPRFTIFLFMLGGWIISVSLHEFGHAIVAFWGGDKSVIDKGYLTLNPLKYTHPLLSLVLPVLIVLAGSIGFPGGAVYINTHLIKGRWRRSLATMAGPVATGILGVILAISLSSGLDADSSLEHFEFWAGLAALTSLQITAFCLTLLPIPGLDGFGIIEPFLPTKILNVTHPISQYAFLILVLLFFSNTPVSRGFWIVVHFINQLINLDPNLVHMGFRLFHFWAN